MEHENETVLEFDTTSDPEPAAQESCTHPGVGTLVVIGAVGFGCYQGSRRYWAEWKLRRMQKQGQKLVEQLKEYNIVVADDDDLM